MWKEIIGAIERIVPTSKRRSAVYTINDFVRMLLKASTCDTSVGGTAAKKNTLGDYDYRHDVAGIDDGDRTPSDEWCNQILRKIKEEDIEHVLYKFNTQCMDDLLRQKGGKGSPHVTVAIDEHDIRRYDKNHDGLVKTYYDRGTAYRERYVVAQIVDGKNMKKNNEPALFLGAANVVQGYNKTDFVRKIIQFCLDQGVKIDLLLLDRGFFSVDIINMLNDMGMNWLMPCVNTDGVVEALRDYAAGRRRAVEDYTLTSSKYKTAKFSMHIEERRRVGKKGGGRKSQEFAAPDDVQDLNPEDRYIGFASNLSIIDVKKYSRRWMIESSFRVVEDNRAKTRCDSTAAHVFCFVFSLLLYNARSITKYLLLLANNQNSRLQRFTHSVIGEMLFQCSSLSFSPRPPPKPPP